MQPTMREVLDKVLERIGPSLRQTVYEDLEKAGMCLDCEGFSTEELEKSMQRIFGEAASLIMDSVRRHLKGR
jgi:hypothetical protein